jgi:hypothetical protein
MKRSIILAIMALSITLGASAQSLELKDTEVELSKDAKKAAKKGALSYMGSYFNKDFTEMYGFYRYEPKKSPVMMDVAVFSTEGDFKELRTEKFTADNLLRYDLHLAEEITNNSGSLSGKKVGYFKRPVMPGKPSLITGYFENRYTNNLWTGYDFVEEDKIKIEPKFWPFFTVALEGDQEKNDNYLLKKVSAWGRLFQGNRNYIGMQERVLIGGQKAEMKEGEPRIFYLGIFNMATKAWESGQDIDMGAGINPGLYAYHQDEAGRVHCLVGTERGFTLLQVDNSGKLLHKVALSIPFKGNSDASHFTFKSDGETVYVASAHYGSARNWGDPSVVISKVVGGKEVLYMEAPYETLESTMSVAEDSKVKYKKEKGLSIDRIEIVPGGYLLFFSSSMLRGATQVNEYAAHFNNQGQYLACYAANGATPAGGGKGAAAGMGGHLEPLVAVKDGKVYWLTRFVPANLSKGVFFNTDFTDRGYITVTTLTTMRNDETYQQSSLMVIDLEQKTVSNTISPEEILVGALPMRILPNGNVIMNAIDVAKGEYKNLFITL